MKVFADANILLRSIQTSHSMHSVVQKVISTLIQRGEELVLSPQVYYEFWVVSTRSHQANGLALSVQETEQEIAKFQQVFSLLEDSPALFSQWLSLVRTYAITGKRAHDTRLVAAMQLHQITHMLTLNPRDFQSFAGITVLTPADVLSSSSTP
jgi:predicted nucleic acid-binding protein